MSLVRITISVFYMYHMIGNKEVVNPSAPNGYICVGTGYMTKMASIRSYSSYAFWRILLSNTKFKVFLNHAIYI